MPDRIFKLKSNYKPEGDQPRAISELLAGLKKGMKKQTLLGATGTGKTFTVANVIETWNKPTLVIAHNKTLAAQLAQEFREFFPDAAVHYFVSYYDYYQPEAYMPITDTYIEKDAQINKEIDRLRHATTESLLTRRDVIIVASVSCVYGLGSPEEYEKVNLKLEVGMSISRLSLIRKLIEIHFTRTNADITSGVFRSIGNKVEIMPVSETFVYQVEFEGSTISKISKVDPISSKIIKEEKVIFLFPAKHFITDKNQLNIAIKNIKKELNDQIKKFEKEGKLLEAERIKRRTNYDLAMMKEIGYCNGVENYSRHLSGKNAGEPPETLLSYFPHKNLEKKYSRRNIRYDQKELALPGLSANDGENIFLPDFLTIIDESHVTLPQISGMYAGDASRKNTLVEFGFRLSSARDNRPLKFNEFEDRINEVIYVSATPGKQEKETSEQIVEQIIRPTGLLDPEVVVKPVSANKTYPGQIEDFIEEAKKVIKKGDRVMATTLTKKMAEDLTSFLKDKGIKAGYLHSEIKTIERIQILTSFRKGEIDIIVGVNLLREGLDLPEVSLIGILDADKEGFLRSETSLIQTIGRAARNASGRVILYADVMTGSLGNALKETNRRREIQMAYNKKYKITPQTIKKNIKDITEELENKHEKSVDTELGIDLEIFKKTLKREKNKKDRTEKEEIRFSRLSDEEINNLIYEKIIKIKEKDMNKAVRELDFETAAILRDEIMALKGKLDKKS